MACLQVATTHGGPFSFRRAPAAVDNCSKGARGYDLPEVTETER